MRKIVTPLAFAALFALTTSPVVAQTLAGAGIKQSPFATPPLTVAAADLNTETGTKRVSRTKHRARGVRRHRMVRHHRNRWRNVWIYSYDRHGYRHYEYVRRKFGGYFARGRADCACRRGPHPHYRTHHWHM